MTHRGEKGGYFTLILQPPGEPTVQDVTPKEIVFVLDTSGSMEGFPIEKAKEAMKLALDGLNPQDTFNLITFAGDTHVLFGKPVSATRGNLEKAQKFLASREGGGGTEMMKAIKAALEPSDSQQHLRVVCFMTDGYVGNDLEILSEIQKHPNARVFSFGIGSSVNRLLLDKMAEEGRGEAEYVALTDDGSLAAKRFHERVRSPLLTDISLDFGDLQVADVYPKRINDLFSAKPVIVHGRYTKGGSGIVKLKGKSFGRETVREIAVNFPENEPNHDVLATLWARTRIDDLMAQDYAGVQNGNAKAEVKDTITNLGIEYRLLTQYTSFVAVEERIVTDGGQPRKIEVPVEMPEGVSREGVFGNETVDVTSSQLQTNITTRKVESVPNGTSFSSILRVSPSTRPEPKGGGFQIEGASGSENSFVIDGRDAENFRSDASTKNKSVSFGTFEGKVTKLPKPIVPPKGSWDGNDGSVMVKITVDEIGNVVSAGAESGQQFLRAASEQAARNAKFKIIQPDKSKPVQVVGLIVYNFVLKNKKPQVSIELRDFAVKLSPEEQKRRELAAKVSLTIFNLIERLNDVKAQPGADEVKFVTDGKAEIIVRVKDLKPETIAELKKLGFEVLTEVTSINAVVGRIQIEKIAALAEIDAVTFISPQNR